LPKPGNWGADGLGAGDLGTDELGADELGAAAVMLAPPGSNRAAHFGLVDGDDWATEAPAGDMARPGWERRPAWLSGTASVPPDWLPADWLPTVWLPPVWLPIVWLPADWLLPDWLVLIDVLPPEPPLGPPVVSRPA